jgi:hypothetical protein
MAQAAPTFIQSYIWDLFEQRVEVGYSPQAFSELESLGISQADVLYVLETSSVQNPGKERAHDQCFNLVGRTCDEEMIHVTVCFERDPAGLCVHHVERL